MGDYNKAVLDALRREISSGWHRTSFLDREIARLETMRRVARRELDELRGQRDGVIDSIDAYNVMMGSITLDTLPHDVMEIILGFLSASDVMRVAKTCWHLRATTRTFIRRNPFILAERVKAQDLEQRGCAFLFDTNEPWMSERRISVVVGMDCPAGARFNTVVLNHANGWCYVYPPQATHPLRYIHAFCPFPHLVAYGGTLHGWVKDVHTVVLEHWHMGTVTQQAVYDIPTLELQIVTKPRAYLAGDNWPCKKVTCACKREHMPNTTCTGWYAAKSFRTDVLVYMVCVHHWVGQSASLLTDTVEEF